MNPILWWGKGKVVILVGAWPAASKTNASWPAHRLGRAGEVVLLTGEKVGKDGFSPPFPKGTYPPPARPAGGRAVMSLSL